MNRTLQQLSHESISLAILSALNDFDKKRKNQNVHLCNPKYNPAVVLKLRTHWCTKMYFL
jgi:hypothetical protein